MEQKDGEALEGPAAATIISSSSTSTTVVGSIGTSSCEGSTRCLFPIPSLGSTVFFYAFRCLRKVAPKGAI